MAMARTARGLPCSCRESLEHGPGTSLRNGVMSAEKNSSSFWHWEDSRALNLTCFHASFFPFCPLYWPPLLLSFSRHFFALFSPTESAPFCRAKGTPQSLGRGGFRTDLSADFGKEIPSRNLRKKRSVTPIPKSVLSSQMGGRCPFAKEQASLKGHRETLDVQSITLSGSVIALQNRVLESWSCLACGKSAAGTCSTRRSCHRQEASIT